MDKRTYVKIIECLVYIKGNIGFEHDVDKMIEAVQEEHESYQDKFRTKKYKVEWCRTYYCHGSIEVEARSELEARRKAMSLSSEWEEPLEGLADTDGMQGGNEDEITGVTELT